MTQCILPTELVFFILIHSDPRDIVRWRTVSKWFRAITCDTALWKALYVNATIPRPTGPFPSQSNVILERDLVKSAQLAQSWTSRPMRATSSLKIKTGEPEAPTSKLVHGRWLVACESNRRFVLHDVDPRSRRHSQLVFREFETPVVSKFDVESLLSIEGQCLLYVLIEFEGTPPNLPPWLLFEFRLNSDTGEPYASATIEPPVSERHAMVPYIGSFRTTPFRAGQSRFLFIPPGPNLLFDTQEHLFYRQPPFDIALVENGITLPVSDEIHDPFDHKMVLTDSHFIFLLYYYVNLGTETLIQAFTLPPEGAPGEKGVRVLHLTHQGYLDEDLHSAEIMSDSTDPLTGATTIRLFDHNPRRADGIQIEYIDLVLPKASTDKVLPIIVEEHQLGFPEDAIQPNLYFKCKIQVDPCYDQRIIRGFFIGKPRTEIWDPPENNHVMKFWIDVTQDPWEMTRGKLAPAEWDFDENPEVYGYSRPRRHICFDGVRGRLCYDDPRLGYRIIVADIE